MVKLSAGVAMLIALSAVAGPADGPVGVKRFTDPGSPQSYRVLAESEAARAALGRSIFETQWVPAGAPEIPGRHGLGPAFNAVSCSACHLNGAHGLGPVGNGPLPMGLVIQLELPPADADAQPTGDPVYGRVMNTAAVPGAKVEGIVSVQYREISGYYYPDGTHWKMREPHYQLTALAYGPLAPATVIKPRLAPPLFGVGLLEAVPETAINDVPPGASIDSRTAGTLVWYSREGTKVLGRLGWQEESLSVRDQTTKALAREMGVTSIDRASDDCTPAEGECQKLGIGVSPEISDDLLDAVVGFVSTLAVPESPKRAGDTSLGSELFTSLGCSECHRPQMQVMLPAAAGARVAAVIAPYTDLRLHDLGTGMADETVAGEKVTTKWRTAPLWGLGYRVATESTPTFLHDGRARSIEEAILWHSGDAAPARTRFMKLLPRSRKALFHWLETL